MSFGGGGSGNLFKGIFETIALKRNNQKLRDRLISEGRIRGEEPRVITPKGAKKERQLDRALETRGILNQQA